MAEESKESRHPQDGKAPVQQMAEQDGFKMNASPKEAWPDLVGLDAAEAEKRIKNDRPGIRIQVVPPDHFVTMDFDVGRVRLYIDSSDKIAKLPRIG
ncbi:subtilisin inhibitor CLSI-I [Elaeis guineensis]|uniref:Subtilisin inhibitor CLSI-I n=1 Tax=Elaeis guineensis var. tenera TaxID=51953 RepID=A0A6I9QE13_ELAGV|nr:subtilisin inhibitor CLSI-I [Elaeis guineensis]